VNIEDRINSGSYASLWEDLDRVVALNLHLRRYVVADFYSKRLLSLAYDAKESSKLASKTKFVDCYVSEPGYEAFFNPQGTLALTSQSLHFEGQKMAFAIQLRDIRNIAIKHYPLWLCPMKYEFLSLTFHEFGQEHVLYLHLLSYGSKKQLVQQWHNLISKAMANCKGTNTQAA
jgi:hypothetical protein